MWNLSKILSAIWGFAGATALITLFAVYANFNAPVDLGPLDVPFLINKQRFFAIFSGTLFISEPDHICCNKDYWEGQKSPEVNISSSAIAFVGRLKNNGDRSQHIPYYFDDAYEIRIKCWRKSGILAMGSDYYRAFNGDCRIIIPVVNCDQFSKTEVILYIKRIFLKNC